MKTIRFITFTLLLAALLPTQIKSAAQSVVNLAVHYVEGTPAQDGISYEVNVYLSVVDGAGIPIRDLKSESFTVVEDSQKVEIQNVGVVTDEPISIVVVMDTSGSMVGTRITDAKAAVTTFISGLKANDQVALISFDDYIKTQSEFTTDHKALIKQVALMDAKRDSGTCLYDAAYSAVNMASSLQSGTRAVILFTDGIDETPSGAVCSAHSADDVIAIAKENTTRTPIYTIGMDKEVDADVLKRMADLTGGYYLFSPSSSQLANVFQVLSDQFRSQYILTYKSISAPGPHNLIASVNQLGVEDKDTRNFLLTPLPAKVVFVNPLDGQAISDLTTIAVSLIVQGNVVQRVAFEVDGKEIGTDETKPYEFNLDIKQFPLGVISITAIAYGENNTELVRDSITILHTEAVPEQTATSASVTETAPTEIAINATPAPESKPSAGLGFVFGGLGIVVIGALLFMLVRQQKQSKVTDDEDDYIIGNPLPSMQGVPIYSQKKDNRPANSWKVESDALGALTIEASDDSSIVGHYFEITIPSITLGRSADNDLNFPNDKPVSRHHAEIYQNNGKLYLRVIETTDASGISQLPKYGTFVNQAPVSSEPILLKTGDEIQLGKRVRLKFEAFEQASGEDAETYDDITGSDDIDKTQDQ